MADFEGWRTHKRLAVHAATKPLCIAASCALQAAVHCRLLCIPHTLLLFPRVLFPPLTTPPLSINIFECSCLTMCKWRQMKERGHDMLTARADDAWSINMEHGASTRIRVTRSFKRLHIRSNPFSPTLFFLSWVANTQLNHWTKWVVCTQLTPDCCTQTFAECDSVPSPQPRRPP